MDVPKSVISGYVANYLDTSGDIKPITKRESIMKIDTAKQMTLRRRSTSRVNDMVFWLFII